MVRTSSLLVLLLQAIQVFCVIVSDENATEVTSNVCSMTLSADGEADEGKRQVKCVCKTIATDCSNLGITELPALISFPKNIVIASFSSNHIEDIKDDTFYSGREIIEMDLSHNRIDFISVSAFNAFKKLQRLKLGHNRIFNLPIRAFDGLPDLRTLDLSFNEIKGIFPDAFEKMKSLEELNLKGNPIRELEPKYFEPLTKLQFLDLDATMLSELPDYLFVFTNKLKILSLANNLLTEVPTIALKPLKALRHLDLSGNPIEAIEVEAFSGLESLLVLYMERMPVLKKIEAHAFGDLVRLLELHCSYNFFLSEIDEKAFINRTTGKKVVVDQLFLRENGLSALSPRLLKWTKNMELDLRGNPWHCDCLSQWLIHLKTKSNFQDHVWCETPVEFRGRKLSSLKDEELPCGMSVLEIAMISCGSLLAVTLLMLIIGFVIHRRRFILYTKPYYSVSKRTDMDEVVYEKTTEP